MPKFKVVCENVPEADEPIKLRLEENGDGTVTLRSKKGRAYEYRVLRLETDGSISLFGGFGKGDSSGLKVESDGNTVKVNSKPV